MLYFICIMLKRSIYLTSFNTLVSDTIVDLLICHTNASQLHEDNDSSRAEQMFASLEVTAPVVLTEDSELTIASPSVPTTILLFLLNLMNIHGVIVKCQHSEDYDFMIACEAKDCKIEWYHLSSVNLTMDEVLKDDDCHGIALHV